MCFIYLSFLRVLGFHCCFWWIHFCNLQKWKSHLCHKYLIHLFSAFFSCITPEELVRQGPVSKGNGFPAQFYFMMKHDKGTNNNNYETIKVTNGLKPTVTTTANVVVVKSEPGEDSSSPSSSPGLEEQARKSPIKIRASSPLKDAKSPNGHVNGMTNGSFKNGNHNQNGHGSDSDSVVSIKSERIVNDEEKDRDEKMETDFDIRSGPLSLSSSPRSLLSSASSTGSRGSPPRPNSNQSHHNVMSSSPRRSPPQVMRDTPTLTITKAKGDSYSQRSSPMSHHSGSSRGGSPPHLLNLNSHLTHHLPPHLAMLNGHGGPPGMFHATQLHARLTENRRDRDASPSIPNGPSMSHLSDKSDPPLSVVTSTSLSFHQGSMYRINGVRPEVISGGAVTPSGGNTPSPNGHGSPPSSNPNTPHHLPHHPHHHHQMLQNGTSAQHLYPHNANGLNHQLPFPMQRKSPNSHMSRSPNSSPANSSSSGSIQHSPGSTGSGGTIIAGGNIGMGNSSTPQTNGTHHVNLSRTPTVIMGEAGGVRTMLWSQPGQAIPNPGLEIGIGGTSPPGSGSSLSSGASSNGSTYNGHSGSSGSHPAIQKGVLSMERLWASEALNLSTGASNTTNGHGPSITSLTNGHSNNEDDDFETPMVCMICDDRATGLHYGIITCEGYFSISSLYLSTLHYIILLLHFFNFLSQFG